MPARGQESRAGRPGSQELLSAMWIRHGIARTDILAYFAKRVLHLRDCDRMPQRYMRYVETNGGGYTFLHGISSIEAARAAIEGNGA